MFQCYVIESNGEFYYSLKGADFGAADQATIFRSEKAAADLIKKAIKHHQDFILSLKGAFPVYAEKAQALIDRWESTAKVVKIA